MNEPRKPDLSLDLYEAKKMLDLIEQKTEIEESAGEFSISNMDELVDICAKTANKHTYNSIKPNVKPWSSKYMITSLWQRERIARVLEHYCEFDEHIETGEPLAIWIVNGPDIMDIDWKDGFQDLTEEFGDRYKGNLNFSMNPYDGSTNLFKSIALANEIFREWNDKIRTWDYSYEFVETYDAIKNSTLEG